MSLRAGRLALLALVLAVLVPSTAGGAPHGWRVYRRDGISVRYPPRWFATARRLTPVTAPAQILAVASFPLPTSDAGADGCEPRQALARLPPDGAILYGWDAGIPGSGRVAAAFPPRPRRFRLVHVSLDGCLGRSYSFRFRQDGRLFQLYVVLGHRAGSRTRATVLRILDSFAVTD